MWGIGVDFFFMTDFFMLFFNDKEIGKNIFEQSKNWKQCSNINTIEDIFTKKSFTEKFLELTTAKML